MRPYCAGAFLFYGHESDAFRRPVFTWYELSKINAHAEHTTKKVLQVFRLTGLCGERGILYHSTIFCNSLIFKYRL